MSVSAPQASTHGRLRYTQRAGVEAPTLSQAWTHGTPVELEDRDYEHARFHEDTGVVLLERDGVIVTVLIAAYEELAEE